MARDEYCTRMVEKHGNNISTNENKSGGIVMIRHICMFTLKEENKEKNIAEFLERAESLKELDLIKKFSVVKNSEKTPATNYDVALIFDFETAETLDEYQKSPRHLKFGEFVGTVKVARACIDYEFESE